MLSWFVLMVVVLLVMLFMMFMGTLVVLNHALDVGLNHLLKFTISVSLGTFL